MRLPFAILCLALSPFCVELAAQTPLTNEDIVKLTKSRLTETFILNLVDQQPSKFSTDAVHLAELKQNGVSERVIAAVAKKTPPQEPLTSDGLLLLVKSGFSEGFVLDLINQQPAKFQADASRIIELKDAGVSERVLAALVSKGSRTEIPPGTEISIRLIDEIDSEKAREGQEFRASLDDPITLDRDVIAPKGADAVVKLVAEKDPGKFTGKTELTVQLVSVTIRGKAVPFQTSTVSQESKSRGTETAKKAGVVGGIGAIIGAIAGGAKGAAIGAGAGAAAGAGSQVFMKGQRVKIPPETVLTFTTEGAVSIQ